MVVTFATGILLLSNCAGSVAWRRLNAPAIAHWERGLSGPDLMQAWLRRFDARPIDFNRALDDVSL